MTASRAVVAVCSASTALIGLTVLAGWTFDVPVLRSLVPGYVEMKANTAVGLAVAGVTLWLLAGSRQTRAARLAGNAGAGFLVLLGGATLSQSLFGWDLGIDQLLFYEAPTAVATSVPGRMASQTAVNFVLKGLALLWIDWETKGGRRPSQYLSLLSAVTPLQALIAYSYGVRALFGIGQFALVTQMAIHTAWAWIALSVGTLLGRPDAGLMKVFTSETGAGYLARRLLLPSILIPLVLGWFVATGERAKLYDAGFGTSVLVLTNVIIFALLVGWAALGLYRLEAERAASQAHIGLAYDIARLGTWDHDYTQGLVMRWSDQCKAIYGIPAATVMTHEAWAKAVHPDDLQQVEDDRARAFAERRDFVASHRVVWPDGSVRWVEVKARATFGEKSGEIVRVLGVTADITEQAQVIAREQAAVQTGRLKSEFLATMSHELRSPLNSILIFAEILAKNERGSLTPKEVDFARSVHSSGLDLLHLIEDILDLSKVEAGRLELRPEAFGVESLLSGIERVFQAQAERKGLSLVLDAAPDVPAVWLTDGQRVTQIVSNFVANAIKFTDRGGVTVRVERPAAAKAERTADPASAVQIAVVDTGIGIAKEDQHKLFQAFSQVDSGANRRFAGTGLGLSISHKLAELLGGFVEVESELRKGSAFRVILPAVLPGSEGAAAAPAAPSASAAPPTPEAPRIDTDVTGRLKGRKILLADDDVRNIFALMALLEEHGMIIHTAANGREALECLAREPDVALVLMDMMMPELDGYAATRAIRADARFRDLPVIALTARAMKGEREDCLAAGATDYLAKPFKPEQLLGLIAGSLGETG